MGGQTVARLEEVAALLSFARARYGDRRLRMGGHGGEPFFVHAGIVSDALGTAGVADRVTLFASALHDIISLGVSSVEEIRSHFGSDVAEVVRELTPLTVRGAQGYEQQTAVMVGRLKGSSRSAQLIRLATRARILGVWEGEISEGSSAALLYRARCSVDRTAKVIEVIPVEVCAPMHEMCRLLVVDLSRSIQELLCRK